MRVLTILCLCCLFFSTNAQEQLGLRLDKYSGVNGLSLNPSSGSHFALGWDFNLVGAGFFFENNHIFAAPTNVPHFLKHSDQVGMVTDTDKLGPPPEILVDFNNDNKPRFFNLYTEILGPGLMVNINATHAVGFQTKLKSSFGGFNMDNDLGYYKYQEILDGNPLELEPFSISGMVWQEYAFSYSNARETSFGKMSIGASLKLLRAYESFYVDIAEPILAAKVADDSLDISSFDVRIGYTTASIAAEGFANEITGQGFGVDLGATFLFDTDEEGGYFAKVGVAILDLAKVNFNTQTERYAFKNKYPTNLSSMDFHGTTSKEEAFEALSTALLGDSTEARQPAGYSLWAPTALSIQGDIEVRKNLFVAANLIQRVPLSALSVKRNNVLAVAPRFETRWFSVGIPLILYNWQDFRLGTHMRIGFLTIGTDNLGSFVGRGSLTGTDFYFALKVNPFTLNFTGGGGGGKSKGKSVKCYKF